MTKGRLLVVAPNRKIARERALKEAINVNLEEVERCKTIKKPLKGFDGLFEVIFIEKVM